MHVSVCLNVYLGPAEVRRGHQMPRNWRYVCHLVGTGTQTRRSARRADALITESPTVHILSLYWIFKNSATNFGFIQKIEALK